MATKNEAPNLMAIHPGSILKEEILERRISQKELAKSIEMQPSHLNEIIKGKRSINKQVADKLEVVLGIPSIDWVNLQIRFDYDTKQGAERKVAELAAYQEYQEYNKVFDVKTLTSRLGFQSSRYSHIISFLKDSIMLPEPARLLGQANGLFKKSNRVGKDSRMIMTWILLAKYFAYSSDFSGVYDEFKLNELIPQISDILHSNENTIDRLKYTFAKYGILFGVVKKVDGASIDGYSFEYEGHPCIVVTTRFDKIDNLAFSVMHELAHIKNSDNEECRVNLADYDHESSDEKVANAFAANALISDAEWKKMPKVHLSPSSIQRICTNWAESNGYNKWIALGRISHDTGMYKFKSDSSRRIS
jgi:HTH-type transcriptional regulator/antitoxin HigA